MGKGEIARYEKFLRFPQYFQKACFQGASKGVIVWEWVNTLVHRYAFQPITRRQILDFSKLKEFADDNFNFDKNGRKLSKWVENTVGKGEIARYEQFLLFPVFSKGSFPRGDKRCHCLGMG